MNKYAWLVVAVLAGALSSACGNIDDVPFNPCPVAGALGCECDVTGGCAHADDGTVLVCGSDKVCRRPVCGTETLAEGCLCGGNSLCATGLVCANGNCVQDTGQTLKRPETPRCYTPCRGDLLEKRGHRVCSVDGLMEGCIDGALCRDGTCVLPIASTPGTSQQPLELDTEATRTRTSKCESDAECPDFQSCIENACYADCAQDSDCRNGRRCHRQACRVPCEAATTTCPAGTVCETLDGERGYCQPVAAIVAPVESTSGSFAVDKTLLKLSNERSSASFVISNTSPTLQTFKIKKLKHTEYSDLGPKLITENALFWVRLGELESSAQQVAELTVLVDPNSSKTVWLTGAANDGLSRWDGELEVNNHQLGTRSIRLSYTGTLEGQWAGSMYSFANFGDRGLEAWKNDRNDQSKLRAVGNALIRRWGAFRDKRISLDEFKAMLTATQTESWKWPSVKAGCPTASAPDSNVGCYLYDNNSGIGTYSDFLPDNPIPTGVSELPIVFNLKRDTQKSVRDWTGKIVSEESLQYAGSPKVTVRFAGDPTDCSASAGGACIIGLDQFSSDVFVGGRYLTSETDTTCAQAAPSTFALTSTPWLIPGFGPGFGAAENAALPIGPKSRFECRDKLLPFSNPDRQALNLNLALSNPIPDGAVRRRSLELLDGALIDQDTMFVLFRERFPSFLDPSDTQGFSAYGYMLLRRRQANLTSSDYQGSSPQDFRAPASRVLNVSCAQDLLDQVNVTTLSASNAALVGSAMVDGVIPSGSPPATINPTDPSPTAERVHYLCAATGFFNGGAQDNGTAGASKVACPPGSAVRYFTLTGATSTQAAVAAMSCQQGGGTCRDGEPCSQATVTADGTHVPAPCTVGATCARKGTCGALFDQWLQSPPANLRLDPVSRCTDPNAVLCDGDRTDLRVGKTFYRDDPAQVVFRRLDDVIHEAFRFKTQFRNRSGTGLGFVPQICVPNSNDLPYCYDPEAIEQIRDRVDCATHVYTRYYNELGTSAPGQEARGKLKSFLARNFSYFAEQVPSLPAPIIHDGFERLYAELQIMLGDESYTSSFASRFDLAGQRLADFQGSLFEPNGINLSGGAGYEMYSLYQAVQYYQSSLDRFYRLSGVFWTSLGQLPPGQGFITPQTSSSYFARLIRASSQKARAWSQISKRYQAFNRPDLARLVVSRAYTSAYLESVVLSRLMQRLIDSADAADRAQIAQQLELAQKTYQAAMMEMSTVYKDISDNITYFGFQPDYIPFPALNPLDFNAFEKALKRANDALATAADKEQIALADNRSFDVDAASFQSALASIKYGYEEQLMEVCGTMQVDVDGEPAIYPAIAQYAYLDPRAAAFGEPCGLMGNGELYERVIGLEQLRIDFQKVKMTQRHLTEKVSDVLALTSDQCGRITEAKDFYIQKQDKIISLRDGINSLNLVVDAAERAQTFAETLAGLVKCSVGTSTDCPTAAASIGAYSAVWGVTTGIALVSNAIIVGLEHEIEAAEKAIVIDAMESECEALQIDAKYEIKQLYREMLELELDALKSQYDLQIALSQLQKLRNHAIYLAASSIYDTSHLIEIEAARNDPNVRIYRNDAIVSADQTFFWALQEAYKATKVFEYYTSQSYAPLQDMVLVRMVSHGDFTLEAYLANLDTAFAIFQEQFGNPDTRVAIISVRDDVLKIPTLGTDGVALSVDARTDLFRERLQHVSLLDDRGYITMPFATKSDELSPLTRNHKVLSMEAELIGRGVGDDLGRLYVRQRGTSTVLGVGGGKSFYAFPERTAVMNPFFNGKKALDASIYKSQRLRDRPFLNTGWEVVLNRKDEKVNKDIRLDAIDDIKLYVYYTDFTQL